MAEHDSGQKRVRPPIASQGVVALLERWVFEMETRREEAPPKPDVLLSPPPGSTPAEASPRASGAGQERASAIRAALEEIRPQGAVFTLPGPAQIVLAHEDGKLIHRGTVGIRGPCAPSSEEWLGIGLKKAQAQALEFVLAWFGAPFDAATGGEEPCWGTWPFSGRALIEVLARWKRLDAAAFNARLGRWGVDVTPGPSSSPSSLTVIDTEQGRPLEGQEALSLLGEDARLFAALAHAGRERSAQLAQLRFIAEKALLPLLARTRQEPSSPLGLALTPRMLALLLHSELRLGFRGSAKLAALAREDIGKPRAEEHTAQRFAAELHASGRPREASEVRRILYSPELAAALA
ncbi:hypothetical protein [Stigmatella aurantiaca]|uniref:Uncharacterized protein n=1 Tax=Stigmatella aurantiaca (strain DW4/3-1) TaxID=378806 RepID=Q099R0_STIAD|nr:hypothetical protein [Stigmatella aurantiaca]ADO75875.1 uncharacterized protein STAUR_8120 [Stigmatella aurantiaca DW4/3-1]EAU68443.1 hypothetical protein STIAU_3287 [Stigmatella aurantiaca DW4/3-1]